MRLLSIGRVPYFNLLLVGLGFILPGISFYVIGALRMSREKCCCYKVLLLPDIDYHDEKAPGDQRRSYSKYFFFL